VLLQQVRRPFDIFICFPFLCCAIKIPSTTNEEHYGNKQTLCLNFKFRVQQMKSNMGKSFALAFAFNP
jgi:hypothetical protein